MLIVDALAARFGGTAYAVIQLAAALGRRDRVEAVHVIAQRGSIVAQGIRTDTRVRLIDPVAPRPGELAWRAGWEVTRLPALVKRLHIDGMLTCSGMLPRHPDCRIISLLANPTPYVGRTTLANRVRRAVIARTSAHADVVYVPSSHMRELVGTARPAKVVPFGVDREVFRPASAPGDQILYVADFYDHKRHDLALAAWRLLEEPRPVLRLIGNPAVDPRVFERVRAAADDPRIRITPRASLAELLEAYASARLMILPSERESFSMPLAEAINAGVPAVIRDDPVLRETGGPGAIAVKSQLPAEWASTITDLLRDDGLHAATRAAGVAYGERYSWARMADEVVADVTRR